MMKKKHLAFFMAFLFAAGFYASPVYAGHAAGDPAHKSDAIVKLGRGFANILASPLEYLIQFGILEDRHNPIIAVTGSIIYGTLFMAGRILGGVYEVVTFPLPFPAGYAPLMDPETPIEAYKQIHGNR